MQSNQEILLACLIIIVRNLIYRK